MRNIAIFFLLTTISACSSINSLAPFDQEQARILIQQEYMQKYGHPLPSSNTSAHAK